MKLKKNVKKSAITKIKSYVKNNKKYLDFISNDSPFISIYIFICFLVFFIDVRSKVFASKYFSLPATKNFNFFYPISYLKTISYIFGHLSWIHLNGNIIKLLFWAPAVEKYFDNLELFKIIITSAISSSLGIMVFDKRKTYGSSGIVYSMIVLNFLIEFRTKGKTGIIGTVPSALFWQIFFQFLNEYYNFLNNPNISHITHLMGAIIGFIFGMNIQ